MQRMLARRAAAALAIVALVGAITPTAHAVPLTIVSLEDDEDQHSLWSFVTSVSPNGRYVVYTTGRGDGSENDVWLRDVWNGETTLVSENLSGNPANGSSDEGRISSNGNYVVFTSIASDIVDDDTNGAGDVFRWNTSTGETVRVSESESGVQGDAWSGYVSVSGNGRYVAFQSWANNLIDDVTGDYGYDVFVKDVESGEIEQANVTSSETEPQCYQAGCGAEHPAISDNGDYVAFLGLGPYHSADENMAADIYRRDLESGTTVMVTNHDVANYGSAGFPALSADGSVVAFLYYEYNWGPVGAYYYDFSESSPAATQVDLPVGSGEHVLGADGQVSISPDGRRIGFTTWDDLDGDDDNELMDGYVYDRDATQELSRVTVADNGDDGNDYSYLPMFTSTSVDKVFFSSYATNFSSSDTNGAADVFRRDL
jgi:hypothetical protein